MQVAEIEITYCDYKVYMLQFKYGCYHALKSFGSLSRSKNAGILLNKKDKMTIKVSKRNKIINKMHKNSMNIDCSFDIIMLC